MLSHCACAPSGPLCGSTFSTKTFGQRPHFLFLLAESLNLLYLYGQEKGKWIGRWSKVFVHFLGSATTFKCVHYVHGGSIPGNVLAVRHFFYNFISWATSSQRKKENRNLEVAQRNRNCRNVRPVFIFSFFSFCLGRYLLSFVFVRPNKKKEKKIKENAGSVKDWRFHRSRILSHSGAHPRTRWYVSLVCCAHYVNISSYRKVKPWGDQWSMRKHQSLTASRFLLSWHTGFSLIFFLNLSGTYKFLSLIILYDVPDNSKKIRNPVCTH